MGGSPWVAAGDGAQIADTKCGELNASIHGYEKGEQWEFTLGFLQEMGHQLLPSDVVSWDSAISVCEKGKQWERALGLLQEIAR